MKRAYASGHAKRVEKEKRIKSSTENVPKLTSFFAQSTSSASAASTTNNEYDVTVNVSCDEDQGQEVLFKLFETDRKDVDPARVLTLNENDDHTAESAESPVVGDAIVVQHTSANADSDSNCGACSFQMTNNFPSDRGLYQEHISDAGLKDSLAKHGACQPNEQQVTFPTNDDGRKFSSCRYFTTSAAGIAVKLKWLSYSPTLNSVYCHSCWLFADRNSPQFRSDWINGVSDWGHLSQKIKKHQDSSIHHMSLVAEKMYLEQKNRIDKEILLQITTETNFWYQVLERLTDIVFTLASGNLPFRGHREHIGNLGSGNFLALVELVAKYDPVLNELIHKPKGSLRYLSPDIQNELISVLGNELRQHLTQEIRSAAFFTITGDSTKDVSKVEQFSNCYRYVVLDFEANTATVRETFLGFIPERDQSAEAVADLIMSQINAAGLDILRCRGQGYDGAAVMSGIYAGVQKRIIAHSPNAQYVHCVCHRLNLVLRDAAECCPEMQSFFGTVEDVYNFFGFSAPNWALLKAFGEGNDVRSYTLKHLSSTRWESRHKSVQALIAQYCSVLRSLAHLKLVSHDAQVRSNATRITENITRFEFIVLLILWEQILRCIYAVSKQLQSKSVNLSTATRLLKEAVDFVCELRSKFDDVCRTAESTASKWGAATTFKESRTITKKRFFGELASDCRLDTPRDRFRVKIFLPVVDKCIMQLKTRFESLHNVTRLFSFLFPEQLMTLSECDLQDEVTQLTNKYENDVSYDLYRQLLAFRTCAGSFIQKAKDPHDILNVIMSLEMSTCFPDVVTAYVIFLTLPVSVASNERSFSKLKLLKTFLRATMSHDRLSDLAILSIERDRFREIDKRHVLEIFAQKKARKVKIL
jgi:hypothetical protein